MKIKTTTIENKNKKGSSHVIRILLVTFHQIKKLKRHINNPLFFYIVQFNNTFFDVIVIVEKEKKGK